MNLLFSNNFSGHGQISISSAVTTKDWFSGVGKAPFEILIRSQPGETLPLLMEGAYGKTMK